jgi:hypothetical protein
MRIPVGPQLVPRRNMAPSALSEAGALEQVNRTCAGLWYLLFESGCHAQRSCQGSPAPRQTVIPSRTMHGLYELWRPRVPSASSLTVALQSELDSSYEVNWNRVQE